MAISFNEVPSQIRVPFLYAEFDNSQAVQGLTTQEYRTLLIGQKLSGGSQAVEVPVQVTSLEQAESLFGAGSILAQMVAKYLDNVNVIPLTCMAVDDDGAAVASTGNVLIGGAPSAAGTLAVYIGGRAYKVAVATSDTAADIATALQAEIAADTRRVVDAAVNGGTPEQVDLTARNAGLVGDQIDVRVNFFSDEALPAGVTVTITAMNGGATNPDLTDAIAAIGETQYIIIGTPYTDASNLTLLETELADRFGPIRQNDGYHLTANRDTLNNLSTLGDSRNSQFTSIMGIAGPNSPWEWVGAICGTVAEAASIDPARPFQTLPLSTILPPSESEQFTLSERNTLLFDGIATYKVDSGGVVRIERMITTYKTNQAGAPDISYLDLNTLLTLSFLRFDYRSTLLRKYPRHKLANDGTRFALGQAVVTPNLIRGETVLKFRQWEEQALVEGIDQFKEDLIVERNADDPNRLDVLLPPDLVNQLRVTGVKIAFLL